MTALDVTTKPRPERRRTPRALKELWRGIRKPLANSVAMKHALASFIGGGLQFVHRTNRLLPGSSDIGDSMRRDGPAIYTVWHGQHLIYPAIYASIRMPVDVMVSRSADAEINAIVLQRFGVGVVRGSGGRGPQKSLEKGGARALIALKKSLDTGRSVAMVADIPNGTPRDAGLGVVTLARISGRPIVPVAYASSRRKVVERSWDKMTISLPFGRGAVVVGEPIPVPADASDEELQAMRATVTAALDDVTRRAYAMVDGADQ